MAKAVDFSIVTPLYNEEESVPALLAELARVCGATGKSYEIILVDDGSRDRTFELIEEAARHDKHLKIVRLSRNFGHQAAFNAGLDVASGEAVITMDGDLQHPPRLIPTFLAHAANGYDIIVGERVGNLQNSRVRELIGKSSYKMLAAVTDLDLRPNISDFALYHRRVVNALKQMPERDRFLRGLVQWVGFRKIHVPYVADERRFGKPKYTWRRLARLGMSGLTSFSAFPLRLALWLGIIIFLASAIFGGYVVYDHFVHPNPLIPGWATVVTLLLFLGSLQLLVIGIMGEYLYRMFNELKGRPMFIVSETRNIDPSTLEKTPYSIHA